MARKASAVSDLYPSLIRLERLATVNTDRLSGLLDGPSGAAAHAPLNSTAGPVHVTKHATLAGDAIVFVATYRYGLTVALIGFHWRPDYPDQSDFQIEPV